MGKKKWRDLEAIKAKLNCPGFRNKSVQNPVEGSSVEAMWVHGALSSHTRTFTTSPRVGLDGYWLRSYRFQSIKLAGARATGIGESFQHTVKFCFPSQEN